MSGVDWGPGLAVLGLGLLLGGLVLWRVTLAGAKRAPAGLPASQGSDLEAQRDVLFQQLRELEDTESKRTPEQLARERYALELQAARAWQALDGDREGGKRPARPDTVSPAPAVARPALRGFFWGLGSAATVGLLLWFVARGTTPRENASPAVATSTSEPADQELARYKATLERNPDDFDTRIALARVYLGRQDLMSVWNETQYVLARSPGHPRALAYQALVRLAMGQGDVALEMLKQAKAQAPDLLEVHLHQALVYVRLGRVSEAEAVMAEAKKRFPGQAPMLAALMTEMKQQTPETASSLPEDPHASVAGPKAAAGGIAGQLDLAPTLKESLPPGTTIFLTLRAAGAEGGPPIAVKRLAAGSFPLGFAIGAADSMMGQQLPERVKVEARADSDGDPLTRSPADPKAWADDVRLGTANLVLTLRR